MTRKFRTRKRGRPEVPRIAPHSSLSGRCKHCHKYHTPNKHRFHGFDAYSKTHKKRRH